MLNPCRALLPANLKHSTAAERIQGNNKNNGKVVYNYGHENLGISSSRKNVKMKVNNFFLAVLIFTYKAAFSSAHQTIKNYSDVRTFKWLYSLSNNSTSRNLSQRKYLKHTQVVSTNIFQIHNETIQITIKG